MSLEIESEKTYIDKKVKKRAALVAAVLILMLICSIVFIIIRMYSSGASIVRVYRDGELIDSHLLSENGTYTYELENGAVNTIIIEEGSVWVSYANCDNQTCVNTGKIRNASYPIVCLPHRLVIQIEEGDSSVNGVAR